MSDTLPTVQNELFLKRLPIAPRETGDDRTDDSDPANKTWGRSSLFGWTILGLFFVIFGGWSYIAPLASAVRAAGTIRVVSEQQAVQHLEGGIVKELLVREGDTVEEGQVLLRLSSTTSSSEYARLKNQLFATLAEKARLEAERSGAEEIVFPERLFEVRRLPEIAKLIEQEIEVFETTRQSIEDRIGLIQERIAQIQLQVQGSRERLDSTINQIALVDEELTAVRSLYEKGLERKPRLLALGRNREQLIGFAAQLKSSIAQGQQSIGEQELRLVAIRNERETRIADALRANSVRLEDLRQNENIFRDRVERVDITAPRSGQVVDMAVHTVNGVVRGGEVIMSIVPTNDELIVTAKVQPKDVDVIMVGAPVQLQLSAFNPRTTPPIEGLLTSISLDSVTPSRGQPYFEARIIIDPESIAKNIPDAQLTAGMRASALISVGERTLFEYLVTPLSASLQQAMREP